MIFLKFVSTSSVLQGDPRVNIQNSKGKAKPYQVRQVLQAVDRLEVENDE